jgi:hypothetical protein
MDQYWIVIPIIAILAGTFKEWMKVRSHQRMLGSSARELEAEVAALRKEREAILDRIENLEAIVVSQTWDVVNDRSLPPAERERKLASTVRHEVADRGPSYQQQAEQLARRLQG